MTDKRKDEMKQYDKYIAKMDAHEMACRLAEAAMGLKREAGLTAEQAMQAISLQDKDAGAAFYRMALAAAKYMEDAINDFQRVQ